MNRRGFLAGVAATLPTVALAQAKPGGAPSPGLAQHARRSGRSFGCAIRSSQFAKDPAFIAAVVREANVVVQEGELKRSVTQPAPGRFNFAGADKIIDFAMQHGMAARGHTLAWYAANPPWLEGALRSAPLRGRVALLTGYINVAMRRYAGRISEWDVVNEAIEPKQNRADGMRDQSMWLQTMGERYIDLAFRTARRADPKARLFLTDFGLEHDSRRCEQRRNAMLRLLDRLMSRQVPIDALGIQGHLKPYREGFNQRVFADFLERVRGFGLRIAITEFDLADLGGPPDIAKRDAEIAAVARAFLDVALASPAVDSVLTWGLSDRYSWLSTYDGYRWPDGQPSRGLPLDINLRRKPLWSAIAAAFDGAPARRMNADATPSRGSFMA
ncbi:endo-1,4-beta-xylanase [Sphingomonas sp.]|uniref:endo-1,4-beta-xylanase n=1 Tax=Sphingomonas sp. TaxID=28214 RepID=UPI003D6D6C73